MTAADASSHPRRSVLPAAVAGALAAGVALGVAELTAGLLAAVSSPVQLVGDRVIDAVPPAIEDAAITLFGTADKLALQIGTVVIGLAAGALLGVVARRTWSLAALGFVGFGVLGVLAAVPDRRASPLVVAIAVAAGVGAGLAVLRRTVATAATDRTSDTSEDRTATDRTDDPRTGADDLQPVRRLDGTARRSGTAARRDGARSALLGRRDVVVAGGLAVTAVASGAVGRWLLDRRGVGEARAAVRLPPVRDPLPSPSPETMLDVEGITPLFVPNDRFYRIDTALSVPQVDPSTWTMRITGLVDRPFELTYRDLQRRADREADVTIACVSNQVGGDLVGNARWLGVSLKELLDEAGVAPDAAQVVGRSVDGFTGAFPVAAALDGREALVAIGMNGEPLPLQHGFPARLVVPGLYGYVSATKWLAEIELVTEEFDGYWIPRGWAKRAPIKTQSRFDVPRSGLGVPAGRVALAGVAWAGLRGVSAVEVRIDDGPWRPARLSASIGPDSWRQWTYDWDAPEGRHRLQVRATDGDGRVQTAEPAPPRPDGATGHHTISVDVTAA